MAPPTDNVPSTMSGNGLGNNAGQFRTPADPLTDDAIQELVEILKRKQLPNSIIRNLMETHIEHLEGLITARPISSSSASIVPVVENGLNAHIEHLKRLLSADAVNPSSNLAPSFSSPSHPTESTPLLPSASIESPVQQQAHWAEIFSRFTYFLRQCRGVRKALQPSANTSATYKAMFIRHVRLEFTLLKNEGGNPQQRFATALIDFHSPFNLISRRLANRVFAEAGKSDILQKATPKPIFVTLGHSGGVANAVGEIDARWGCLNDPRNSIAPNPYLNFDLIMFDSKFQVMEEDACRYDVIIGVEDIIGYDLLGLTGSLPQAAVHFRRQAPAVDPVATPIFDSARTAATQREAEAKERDRAWEKQRDDYASQHAAQEAHAYADAEVAKLGPDQYRDSAWQALYDRAYDLYYPRFKIVYQERYPRPNSTR